MADQQPTGMEEGDNSLTASHLSPTSSDALNGGAQQEETAYSDSDSEIFLITELSKPPSVLNGEKVIIYGNTCAAVACAAVVCAPLTSVGLRSPPPLPTSTIYSCFMMPHPPRYFKSDCSANKFYFFMNQWTS